MDEWFDSMHRRVTEHNLEHKKRRALQKFNERHPEPDEPADEPHQLDEPDRQAADSEPAHVRLAEWPVGGHEAKLHDWLSGLDRGRGKFLQYFDALRQGFSADLSKIKGMQLKIPCGAGNIGTISPEFWQICATGQLGVYCVPTMPLGHQLVFAKGIRALPEPLDYIVW
jgi:hypothetical protein